MLVYTKITEVNLSAFICSLFHEDFSSIVGINPAGNSQPGLNLLPGLNIFYLSSNSQKI